MFDKIYSFLNMLQEEIGNDVKITLSASNNGTLKVIANWYDEGYYTQYVLSGDELSCVWSEEAPVMLVIEMLKKEYTGKSKGVA
jgi:hypothetical protein